MRVLIVRLGAVGDVVRALPVIKVIRYNLLESQLFWLVGESAKGILEGEDLDGFFTPRNLGDLRDISFDLVIDLQGLFKSSFISSLLRKREVIGPSNLSGVKEPSWLFYNKKVKVDPFLNRVYRNIEFLRSIGFSIPTNLRFRAKIRDEDLDNAYKVLKDVGIKPGESFITIHPGSSERTPYKRWGEENFSKLIELIVGSLGLKVLLTWGSLFERKICEKVRGSNKYVFIFPKKVKLKTLSAVYSLSKLFIGNDTGPLHIASFSGANVLGIYGPTNVLVNRPVGEGICEVIYKKVDCSPCRKRNCALKRCFSYITPDLVFTKVLEILRRAK